ncbi:hypothetical protein CVT24_002279 [Panaeolus cyanescens]|uniref:peptidylprolyl isomerase n=1 Tax=Panaeolus cyanescens TaxID=181874 RepID=A0A409YIV4_9AGAR|nr:hypothetical protein CVT24_002279 [Panaeolus cyanescens]
MINFPMPPTKLNNLFVLILKEENVDLNPDEDVVLLLAVLDSKSVPLESQDDQKDEGPCLPNQTTSVILQNKDWATNIPFLKITPHHHADRMVLCNLVRGVHDQVVMYIPLMAGREYVLRKEGTLDVHIWGASLSAQGNDGGHQQTGRLPAFQTTTPPRPETKPIKREDAQGSKGKHRDGFHSRKDITPILPAWSGGLLALEEGGTPPPDLGHSQLFQHSTPYRQKVVGSSTEFVQGSSSDKSPKKAPPVVSPGRIGSEKKRDVKSPYDRVEKTAMKVASPGDIAGPSVGLGSVIVIKYLVRNMGKTVVYAPQGSDPTTMRIDLKDESTPQGIKRTLHGMYIGEKRKANIPWHEAFGKKGSQEFNVPAETNIRFGRSPIMQFVAKSIKVVSESLREPELSVPPTIDSDIQRAPSPAVEAGSKRSLTFESFGSKSKKHRVDGDDDLERLPSSSAINWEPYPPPASHSKHVVDDFPDVDMGEHVDKVAGPSSTCPCLL